MSAERIIAAARLVHSALATGNVITVTSAMGGTTDSLSRLADSKTSYADWRDITESLTSQYLGVAARLAIDDAYVSLVSGLLMDLRDLYSDNPITEFGAHRDRIMGFGERLTAPIFAGCLAKLVDLPDVRVFDGTDFFLTDDNFTDAWLIEPDTYDWILQALRPQLDMGQPAVVTGYCGRTRAGQPTTLGRGGSDSTATVIARSIGAQSVTLWSDVPGVMTADPRRIPDARTLPHLTYAEAAELSFYGAKVLHPRAMQAVSEVGVPVLCKSTFNPDVPGTLIDNRGPGGLDPVKACSLESGYRSMSVLGPGMAGLAGVAAQILQALADAGVNVVMLSQACSELALTVVVRNEQSQQACLALSEACQTGVLKNALATFRLRPEPISLLAAVGSGMARSPGVAGRFMNALGQTGVNILAISQADTERNITAAIETDSGHLALDALHREFGLGRRPTRNVAEDGCDLILLGMGQISRKFIRLVQEKIRGGTGLNVVAVADTSGYLLRPAGLSTTELNSAYFAKEEGRKLTSLGHVVEGNAASLVASAMKYRLNSPIVVDLTADSGLGAALVEAKRLGAHVVSANKGPFADAFGLFECLFQGTGMTQIEATVGAGLPVLDTLRSLRETGDTIQTIEGCFSGTLGYIITRVENGQTLSNAVTEALERGYTEPDPAIDLSGLDVYRKALILSRMAGWSPAKATADCRPFILGLSTELPISDLIGRIEVRNEFFADKVAAAAARQARLRYVATVRQGDVNVELKELHESHPLAQLKGTDNMVVFSTTRYCERPLAIMGPGAGPDVTAMGVMADVLRILTQFEARYG